MVGIEGQFFTVSREWIGSMIDYKNREICHSKLFVSDDRFYVDDNGYQKDECEYFVNGVVNQEQIFLQNTVFDTLFEITFHYGKEFKYFLTIKGARRSLQSL